ncbi:hypothetical protein JQ633_07505 [Bradyrhizobium tropiciagri]|uniref:hypothetical protein n=1 Tax=Bradyrhizobium tropiciagri TaxID=312253 RepID=UPI001BAB334B|nr:hypothetical protein [Bradyrhizobium tropiciagri]MBR0870197.1 hypothetical protein [Bradyrhizobium tropiciagri]
MRTSTAYFAGVGTVVAAIAVGVGGGFTIANIVSPQSKQEISRLDRRATSEPAKATPSASPEPTPYLAATQEAATKPVTVAPAPQPQTGQPQQQQAAPPSVPVQAETPAVQDANAQPPSPPAQFTQTVTHETPASAEASNANARARDADVKRASAEKRRAERRQRWAERRRMHQDDQWRRDDQLRDVERSVREETDSPRLMAVEAPRRIELFDGGDE